MRRFISSAANPHSPRSIPAASMSSRFHSTIFIARFPPKTTPSSAHSLTRAFCPGSAMLTQTKSCGPQDSLPWHKRRNSPPTNGNACTRQHARRCKPGSTASTPRPRNTSPRKSPPSAQRWQCTADTIFPARAALLPYSASATPTTKPITAPPAKPAAASSPTARYRVFSAPTGRARSMNSKR